jgi:thiol-disulfide isomerase/thioredoxin
MKTAMKRLIILALAIAPAHAADLTPFAEGTAQQRERLAKIGGAPADEIDLKDWTNSKPLKLADLKGKIVVLDFWATWCGPCLASIPHTNELAEKYAKDVVVIGVCHPKGSEKMKQVVDAKKIAYPVAVDEDGKLAKAYHVDGFPDYYLIDREGTLVLADCDNSKVEDAIRALLGDK